MIFKLNLLALFLLFSAALCGQSKFLLIHLKKKPKDLDAPRKMSMMNKKYLLAVISIFLMASCDPFYGPKFRNEYSHSVIVSVEYEDGQIESIMWPTCRSVFLGRADEVIHKITIKTEEQVLQEFTKANIGKFLAEQGSSLQSVWVFDQDGIKLSAASECSI